MELLLQTKNQYNNRLDVKSFAHMLDDPTQCYKFYWLEAIINLATTEDASFSFEQVIDEMISDAWISVARYHLRLGPSIKGKSENLLEYAIHVLEIDQSLPNSPSREDLHKSIIRNADKLKEVKNRLALNVPYRLLSSFLNDVGGDDALWYQRKTLIAYINTINEHNPLLYSIIDGRGLQKKIVINLHWKQFILDNYQIIKSWIQLKKIRFLQDRNPGVPGIIYKLYPENENARKLKNARELWKCASGVIGKPMRDIYSGIILNPQQFDLDHFIPWSFIANDELWNLVPMERCLNSSKSNKLPDWNCYFSSFASTQYDLYLAVHRNSEVRNCFEKCRRDNLNVSWAVEQLYIEGNSREVFINILSHNFKPIYEAAFMQGYKQWRYSEHVLSNMIKE